MNLEQIRGIDPSRPADRHAAALVSADTRLLDDLVALRRRQGLSQAVVADRMGITPGSVSRIESGDRDPRLSTLRRYAMAIGAVVTHSVESLEGTQR